MAGEVPIFAPNHQQPEPPPVYPPEDQPAAHPVLPPSPEQTRAVEAAFAQTDENARVAALLGFWTSAMVLNDLLQDASEELDRADAEPKRKPGRDTH